MAVVRPGHPVQRTGRFAVPRRRAVHAAGLRHRTIAHPRLRTKAAAPSSATPRPAHRIRPTLRPRGMGRWFWGVLAVAAGLYLAGLGAWVGLIGAAVVLAGLIGVMMRSRWAPLTLWIGLGLSVGVALQLAISIANPHSPGLIPLAYAAEFTSPF